MVLFGVGVPGMSLRNMWSSELTRDEEGDWDLESEGERGMEEGKGGSESSEIEGYLN